MNSIHVSFNKWVKYHPWWTMFIVFSVLPFFLILHRITKYSMDICLSLVLINAVFTIVMMVCDIIYKVKTNYQPPRCKECGHVLPEAYDE